MRKRLLIIFTAGLLLSSATKAQNIFSGERVQVVGAFNGYVTTPYGTDYRTTTYRRLSVASGTPTDGRGQWATTINVQNTGGNVPPINMPGGGSNGFLFISGPAANRFQNKWVFSGIGQGTVDGVNNISAFNSGNDMGLNMSTTGHYTFVFNDVGYTQTNARYYVGFTANAPVNVTRSSETLNLDGSATIEATASAALSPEEKVYIRYTTGADFSGSSPTSIVQMNTAASPFTATIPTQPLPGVLRYYIFTSTRTLAQLTANTEAERSLATLRYDDNAGANYTYVLTVFPLSFLSFTASEDTKYVQLNWKVQEAEVVSYELQRSSNAVQFTPAAALINGRNSSSPEVATYSTIDQRPNNGNNFYRVKATKRNGAESYSNIIRVYNGRIDNSLLVFPNPANKQINVRLVGISKGQYQLSIFNEAGQKVLSQTVTHDGSDYILTVNLPANLQEGTYRIYMSNGTEFYKQLFMKQ
jgi:Secretion system C-terminal sorting domain